jgi:DNA-binding NtrC family response regulator
MQQPILVVTADQTQRAEICDLLEEHNYRTLSSESLVNVAALTEKSGCGAMILDLDTLPIDNRGLRDLKRKSPDLHIIAVSSHSFHPELREAITDYIYACLCRPVDPDELIYWIKTIHSSAPSLEHHLTQD